MKIKASNSQFKSLFALEKLKTSTRKKKVQIMRWNRLRITTGQNPSFPPPSASAQVCSLTPQSSITSGDQRRTGSDQNLLSESNRKS